MTGAARARARGYGWQSLATPLIYAAALVGVEVGLIARGHLLAGDIADAVLLLALVNAEPRPTAAASAARDRDVVAAMRALALVPLIRVASLGLPLRDGSHALGTLVVAALIGGAAIAVAPVVGVPRRILLAAPRPGAQLLTATAGLILGLLAYLLGAPQLWSAGAPMGRVLVALLAAVTAAAVEEVVFRGLVQVSLQRVAGRAGLLAAIALFATLYLDAGSAALVMVFAVAGVVFAYAVARTGALAGSVVGHVLLALGAGALWPAVLGRRHPGWIHAPGTTIVLAGTLVVVTAIALRRPVVAVPVSAEAKRGWRKWGSIAEERASRHTT